MFRFIKSQGECSFCKGENQELWFHFGDPICRACIDRIEDEQFIALNLDEEGDEDGSEIPF